MTLTLAIPDSISASLHKEGDELRRAVLEGFAVESYRLGELSAREVGELLGHESRWETEDFLSAHGAWPALTAEDVRDDAAALNGVLSQ